MNSAVGKRVPRGGWWGTAAVVAVLALVATGVTWGRHESRHAVATAGPVHTTPDDRPADRRPGHRGESPEGRRRTVTLAFAGDTHFQLNLAALLDHPRGALGPIARTLKAADLTMVNLESAVAVGGTPDPKELEVPSGRYWFRTSPRALDVLAAAGVDVVTVANNHGADYGRVGLAETLRARRGAPLAVVGVGRNRRKAFTPYRVRIHGTDIAVLAADSSPREGSNPTWAAGPRSAGIAAAHSPRPAALLHAVRAAARANDVVVVYLHWGTELRSCPDPLQHALARALARAGADVVVGSHAHVLLGSGWLGDTYVDYGLGNFLWYHDHQPVTGVLRVTIRDGKVVGDGWTPARIQPDGRPMPLPASGRPAATAAWRGLRTCTGLAALRPPGQPGSQAGSPPQSSDRRGSEAQVGPRPAYAWSVRRIGRALAHRMRFSHHRGCPVALGDLRYLRMSYVGFDGRSHLGEMVVHRRYARGVAQVFGRLYDAGWPIRQMRLVDDYGGDDRRSMAANNTSGFNCRPVAGTRTWSAHAYGAAIDIDPVENPDLTGAAVAPRAGRRFAAVDRSPGAEPRRGVVTADDLVVRAFARIGWGWGGAWTGGQDYQHFSAGAS